MERKIKQKEATAVINSLTGGVVPKLGVQHITVGRSREVAAILRSLDEVRSGHSILKIWTGDFGSGKSFMLHLLNTVALKQNFAVAAADFTPHTRLYSNDGRAQALYASLMNSLALRTRPEGGALPLLLEQWIEKILLRTASENGIPPTEMYGPRGAGLIEPRIMQAVNGITGAGAFDFGIAVIQYARGIIRRDGILQKNALRWLKGEYTSRMQARKDLGTGETVNDRNCFDMLRNFCRLSVALGYSGLVVSLDEAVNLSRIRNRDMRHKNYEKILNLYNGCLQGETAHLFISLAATTAALEDSEKGLYSHEALKTRLRVNRFETASLRDCAQPVIRLMPLSHDEIFVLLKKLGEIFDLNYSTRTGFSDRDIHRFMEEMYNRPGAAAFLTPREVIREYLNILNLLRQNPGNVDKDQLIAGIRIRDERDPDPGDPPAADPPPAPSAGNPQHGAEPRTPHSDAPPPPEAPPAQPAAQPEEDSTLAAEIRRHERQIENRTVKALLNRMGRVAQLICEKDPSAGELFSMRHAATVTKLLRQYAAMEASGVQSGEMNRSLARIAEALTLTGHAFEQELDSLFRTDMLDIDAESEAYLQSLKNRGLIT